MRNRQIHIKNNFQQKSAKIEAALRLCCFPLICKYKAKTISRVIEDQILWGLMTPGVERERRLQWRGRREEREEQNTRHPRKLDPAEPRGEINLQAFKDLCRVRAKPGLGRKHKTEMFYQWNYHQSEL